MGCTASNPDTHAASNTRGSKKNKRRATIQTRPTKKLEDESLIQTSATWLEKSSPCGSGNDMLPGFLTVVCVKEAPKPTEPPREKKTPDKAAGKSKKKDQGVTLVKEASTLDQTGKEEPTRVTSESTKYKSH